MLSPLGFYRLLLPVYVLVSLPGWLWKMARRGGFGIELLERASFYQEPEEFEEPGRVHVHAVSVGEALLAVKLIRSWRVRVPEQDFVLAVGTATGLQVARAAKLERVRVTYVPVDFRWMVRRYLDRFQPASLVLVEGEMWPNLMKACEARGIRVSLVNARMSPRSKGRYRKFADWVRPVFSILDRVAVQEERDRGIWETLGVKAERVVVAGSIKFDPAGAEVPAKRPVFETMSGLCAAGRPVVLAASTHAGEEALIGRAVREAGGFYLCVPRHAERREEVKAALEEEGFRVVLRSKFAEPADPASCCLVVDTTGELKDWTALGAVVVIGKSFLGVGGQNPAEALLGGVPVVFGPHMENFEPLATELVKEKGAVRVADAAELAGVLRGILEGPERAAELAAGGRRVLESHAGATDRVLDLLI